MYQLIETQKLKQQLLLRQSTLIAKELELAQKQDEILMDLCKDDSVFNRNLEDILKDIKARMSS